jgi:hypothetical protein
VLLFEPIFAALNAVNARYVVVGGVATILHGYIRLTRDVDLVIDLTPDDLRRTLAALEGIGYRPALPVRASDFADPDTRESWVRDKHMVVFSLRNDRMHIAVDLFARYPLDFGELWERSVVLPLRDTSVRVAALDDLIRIKREAGRPQDLLDVDRLEQLRAMRERDGETGAGGGSTR